MRPECIPKLIDGLDAAMFAAWQALRGHHGSVVAGLALTCLALAGIVAHPVARAVLVGAAAAFVAAELAWRIVRRRKRAGRGQSPARHGAVRF